MGHSVNFVNCENNWHNALPLGNGHFGGMVYYQKNSLNFDYNHYDVYYRGLKMHSRSFEKQREQGGGGSSLYSRKTYAELEEIAEKHRQKQGEPVDNYTHALHNFYGAYGKNIPGSSQPKAGSIKLNFAPETIVGKETRLQLQVEDAKVVFAAGTGEKAFTTESYVTANRDTWVCRIKQPGNAKIESVDIGIPPMQGWVPQKLNFASPYSGCVAYTAAFYGMGDEEVGEPPFSFTATLEVQGAEIEFIQNGSMARLHLKNCLEDICIILSVYPNLQQAPDKESPFNKKELENISLAHKAEWQKFWQGGTVCLPDKFIENLWHVNLYTLACASGKGAKLFEQACGLNGLWDVRSPSLWGSMWYWDVNIQAAFAPVFTANHTALGAVFCNALVSYTDLACQYTQQMYGQKGWAADFPHPLFNCIAPWCAQMLWWQYEYTGDMDFLRSRAFPVFLKIAEALPAITKYCEEKDEYYFWPDISPEQGPITKNSVITLASVKYFLRFALKAAEILGEENKVPPFCQKLLAKYPDYPKSQNGQRLRDSHDAPDDLWLRHPSVMMPVYPAGEYTQNSPEDKQALAKNTLEYAVQNTERGVFGFGWLACAAARLGLGQDALHVLCHRGVDLMFTSNGLGHEETERFINFCAISKRAFYHPAMMESTGGLVASVNEMLLQSGDGIIHPFAAVPNGKIQAHPESGFNLPDMAERFPQEEKWENLSFNNFLAKGGFVVSAAMQNGQVERVSLKSRLGGTAKLRGIPEEFAVYVKNGEGWQEHPFGKENGILDFTTAPQNDYLLCAKGDEANEEPQKTCANANINVNGENIYSDDVLCRKAFSRRRVFLGENEDTAYYKALDSFFHPYQLADTVVDNMGVCRFDFGAASGETGKQYERSVHRPVMLSQRVMALGETFTGVSPEDAYTPEKGYGFKDCTHISAAENKGKDPLRADSVFSYKEGGFYIELPQGKYELLLVLGGIKEKTCTGICMPNHGIIRQGQPCHKAGFVCEVIPFIHNNNEPVKLVFSSPQGTPWALSAILVNKHSALM